MRLRGDVTTLRVKEYAALSRWGQLRYRLYRNLFVLLLVAPFYLVVLKHRLPLDIERGWRREWRSVMRMNLSLASITVAAWMLIGLESFLLVQVPITLISGAVGVWLFCIQHQFEDTCWREHPEWDFHRAAIEGSSFSDLPAVLHWFTGASASTTCITWRAGSRTTG